MIISKGYFSKREGEELINRKKAVLVLSVFVFTLFFTLSCFLSDMIIIREDDSQQEDVVFEDTTEPDEDYIRVIDSYILKLRQILKEGEELAARFENRELSLNQMDDFIKSSINTVKEIDHSYSNLSPPQDAENIHQSFGKALENFMSSTVYLEAYLDTSFFKINEKIEYLENAYQKIYEGETHLHSTEQKIEEYSNPETAQCLNPFG